MNSTERSQYEIDALRIMCGALQKKSENLEKQIEELNRERKFWLGECRKHELTIKRLEAAKK